ncbi:hypothetical protein BH09SUM1_BH09SUM1_12200 [soil metagenome]
MADQALSPPERAPRWRLRVTPLFTVVGGAILAVFAALSILIWFVVLPFSEGGFLDDGPFYARPYSGAAPTRVPDQAFPFGKGSLIVYDAVGKGCLLGYTEAGTIKWLEELRVDDTPGNSNTIKSIRIRSIHRGPIRYTASVSSVWTYGAERGTLYLWPSGHAHRLYLSW